MNMTPATRVTRTAGTSASKQNVVAKTTARRDCTGVTPENSLFITSPKRSVPDATRPPPQAFDTEQL
jgi:hypothetical protein